MVDFKMVYNYSRELDVLYVEDCKEVRTSTEEILKEYFLSLDVVSNGLDALKKYKQYYTDNSHYYDLVISDIEMPHLNGIELSDALLEINNEQVIIIFSAYNDPMYLFELMNLGVSSFLYKPIKIEQLNRVLFRISRMISTRNTELERRKYEKVERKFLMGVMDLQDNIIVITDGKHIESANQSLLDFFDFKSVEDFKEVHECICYTFIPTEGYFHLGLLKKNELWIEYILQNQEQDFTVLIQNSKTLKKESFKITVNYFHSKQRYIATFSNITKLALRNKKDHYKAIHDNLTGIYNRNKLNDLIHSHFSPIMEHHFAALLFDIDHFKEINDTYGHLVGDQILKELTSIIEKNIRGSDIFIRWGGDEFILILEELTSEKAIKVAEHLRHTIEQSIFHEVGQLTCSFGVSLYCNGETMNRMIHRVDKALYQAKNNGRNNVVYLEDSL